jgi:hypothetical protein
VKEGARVSDLVFWWVRAGSSGGSVMGKVKKKTDEVKKMADLIAERRKSSHLKRSKSVRASLRFIGARFLSHKSDEVPMQKTPSMSSLHDYQRNLYEYSMLPDVFVKEPVETILKTPMVRLDQKMKLGFHRTKKDKVVSTPPPVVAPKAAQLLQIPIKENCEPISLQPDGNGFHKNGMECHRQGRYEEFGYDYRHNGFYRNTLRLSIVNPRRKNNVRNSSFSATSSTYFPTFFPTLLKR